MISFERIKIETEKVTELLKRKGCDVDFSLVLKQDEQRRAFQNKIDAMKAQRNTVSASIPALKKEGKDTTAIFEEMRVLGEEISDLEQKLNTLTDEMNDFLCKLPNPPDEDLVAGEKESNVELRHFKEKPVFNFKPKDHVELCKMHGMIDYERGAKLSGNGYWIYRGEGARLEWAILNYFVSEHLNDGYEFILPPHMLSYECGYTAGQFPKFDDEVYWIDNKSKTSKFMLPTAETALASLYRNEIIPVQTLPLRMFAYTPCYRREAGSYRSEERGMIRGHQFNKVEMFQITEADKSDVAFEELVTKAARLMEKMGLHFRVEKLAAGDCSHGMARTYDIEAWFPSMQKYQEVSSVSNARDYQARRGNIRYKNPITGKTEFVHTLNGSGLATSRVIPCIVEQCQNEDGSITIPEVLRPFMGGQKYIGKKD